MLYLMTNRINIIIIILLTIKIISTKTKQSLANNRFDDSAKLYGNFTAIEFLKELEHFKPTHDNILIMQNQNATISNIFYTHLIKVLNEKCMSATNRQQQFGVFSETASMTFVNSLMDSLQVSVLQLNELQSFYLKRHYSEHLLSIVYIDINIEGIQMTLNDHKVLLKKLSRNLLHMTTSKVMFLLNFPLVIKSDGNATAAVESKIDEDVIQGILVQLFQHCWLQKIINVVALLADYQITRKFYTYTHFPEFQIKVKEIALNSEDQKEIFPYRLSNLKGYKLPIVFGGSDPRIIPYTSRRGRFVIGGFVGHFIRAFARKYNCNLVQPIPFNPKAPIPSRDLINAVRNGTAEISAGIIIPDITLAGYTYPLQLMNWCMMLPVEANIPGYKYFTSVFKGEIYLLVIAIIVVTSMVLSAALYLHGYNADLFDILCHDNCLRGILGQSFSQVNNPPKIIRFIYLCICLLGILLTTSYTSYFSTYVTRPPKLPALKTYDDILLSGLKIVVWEPEYIRMHIKLENKKYEALFHMIQDYQEFLQLRDSFNTKFGYILPDTKWFIFKQQQKLFSTPLFRFVENLCLITIVPMCFPVQENSLYAPLVNQLILETFQAGLVHKWVEYGFFELINAKKLKLIDLSDRREFEVMTINDLYYILIFLGFMFVVANMVFICEQLVFYRWKIYKILFEYLKRFQRGKGNIRKVGNIN